jgi:hypothetical protein
MLYANVNQQQVLDQENSKKFLQGSEAEKFQFFLKATGVHIIYNHSTLKTPSCMSV